MVSGQPLNDKSSKTDEELLTEEYIRLKGKDNDNKTHPSRNTIPRFYYKVREMTILSLYEGPYSSLKLLLMIWGRKILYYSITDHLAFYL